MRMFGLGLALSSVPFGLMYFAAAGKVPWHNIAAAVVGVALFILAGAKRRGGR